MRKFNFIKNFQQFFNFFLTWRGGHHLKYRKCYNKQSQLFRLLLLLYLWAMKTTKKNSPSSSYFHSIYYLIFSWIYGRYKTFQIEVKSTLTHSCVWIKVWPLLWLHKQYYNNNNIKENNADYFYVVQQHVSLSHSPSFLAMLLYNRIHRQRGESEREKWKQSAVKRFDMG